MKKMTLPLGDPEYVATIELNYALKLVFQIAEELKAQKVPYTFCLHMFCHLIVTRPN